MEHMSYLISKMIANIVVSSCDQTTLFAIKGVIHVNLLGLDITVISKNKTITKHCRR